MNGIPLNVFLSPLLVAIATTMIVAAARHKSASGPVRGVTIVAGLSLLLIGLLNSAFSTAGGGHNAAITAAILGSALLGCFAGYWIGHTSHGPTHS